MATETQQFHWGSKSRERMKGLHPDLVSVLNRAIELTEVDITVLEGVRSRERQRDLVEKGSSRTMNSRHLTGHAVDIAPINNFGKASWDWKLYYKVEKAMKQAAKELGIPIEWGGDWIRFMDGPHWQLPWRLYPVDKDSLP